MTGIHGGLGKYAADVFWAPYGSGFLSGQRVEIELIEALGRGANRTAWQARVGERHYAALIGAKQLVRASDDNVRQLLPQLITSSELRHLVIEHYAQLDVAMGGEQVSIWLTELAAMDLARWRRLGPEPVEIERAGRRWLVRGPDATGMGAQAAHYLRPVAELLHQLHARQQLRTFRYDVMWRDIALDNIALRLAVGEEARAQPTVVLDPEAGRMVEADSGSLTVSGGHYHAIVASPADLALSRLIPLYQAGGAEEAELAAAYRAALDHSNEVFHFGRILQQLAFRIGDPDPGRALLEHDPRGAVNRVYALASACVEPEPQQRPSLGEIVAELRALCAAVDFVPAVVPVDGAAPARPNPQRPAAPAPAAQGRGPVPPPQWPTPALAVRGARRAGRAPRAAIVAGALVAALVAGAIAWRVAAPGSGGDGAPPVAATPPGVAPSAGGGSPDQADEPQEPGSGGDGGPAGTQSVSPSPATAGMYTLSLVAGDGSSGAPVAGAATLSPLGRPGQIAVDADGAVYIADSENHVVERVTAQGELAVIAGTGSISPFVPRPGPATGIPLGWVDGVAIGPDGSLYVADSFIGVVFKVSGSGTLSVFAGDGMAGQLAPGSAGSASFGHPTALAVDAAGSVFVIDSIARQLAGISPDGQLSIFAGTGQVKDPKPGPAAQSPLNDPVAVAVDGAGNLYIADRGSSAVLRISPSGDLSVVAGDGEIGAPEPGPADRSRIGWPAGLAVDAAGSVYIADSWNDVVLKVAPDGILSIIAGSGNSMDPEPRPGPALASPLPSPTGIAVDAAGNVFVSIDGNDEGGRVVRLSPSG